MFYIGLNISAFKLAVAAVAQSVKRPEVPKKVQFCSDNSSIPGVDLINNFSVAVN